MPRPEFIVFVSCALLISAVFANPPRPMPGGNGGGNTHYPGDGGNGGDDTVPRPGSPSGSNHGDGNDESGPHSHSGPHDLSGPHSHSGPADHSQSGPHSHSGPHDQPAGHSHSGPHSHSGSHSHSDGHGGEVPPHHGSDWSSSAEGHPQNYYGEGFGAAQQGPSAHLSSAKLGAIIGGAIGAVAVAAVAAFLYVRSRARGSPSTATSSSSAPGSFSLAKAKPPTEGGVTPFSKENHLPESFDDAVKFDDVRVSKHEGHLPSSHEGSVVMGVMIPTAGPTSSTIAAEGHVVVTVVPVNREDSAQPRMLGYQELPGALVSPCAAAFWDDAKKC